jgi:hypothetical protein
MQKKQHHEVIKMLQPRFDEGQQLSTWHLFFLTVAYYEVRNYSKALATIDLLQKQIDQGDRTYVGSDLIVYPQILRSYVHLDQGSLRRPLVKAPLLINYCMKRDVREKAFIHLN